MREIAKAGAKAAILQGIEADQKAEAEAEAARLLSLAKAKGFDTWEAACEAWEAAQQAEGAKAEREQAEVEAILDGGPDPDLPPASEPVVASSEAFHVAMFEKAIDMLRSVETKPASMFGSAKISPNDICWRWRSTIQKSATHFWNEEGPHWDPFVFSIRRTRSDCLIVDFGVGVIGAGVQMLLAAEFEQLDAVVRVDLVS